MWLQKILVVGMRKTEDEDDDDILTLKFFFCRISDKNWDGRD